MIALVGVALFPVLWGDPSIQQMCGDSGVYELGDCQLGYSFYIAIVCCVLGYFTAGECGQVSGSTFTFIVMKALRCYVLTLLLVLPIFQDFVCP